MYILKSMSLICCLWFYSNTRRFSPVFSLSIFLVSLTVRDEAFIILILFTYSINFFVCDKLPIALTAILGISSLSSSPSFAQTYFVAWPYIMAMDWMFRKGQRAAWLSRLRVKFTWSVGCLVCLICFVRHFTWLSCFLWLHSCWTSALTAFSQYSQSKNKAIHHVFYLFIKEIFVHLRKYRNIGGWSMEF